jgi:hypothetical protein
MLSFTRPFSISITVMGLQRAVSCALIGKSIVAANLFDFIVHVEMYITQ